MTAELPITPTPPGSSDLNSDALTNELRSSLVGLGTFVYIWEEGENKGRDLVEVLVHTLDGI